MTDSADPDQTPRSAASDQDLHCLLMHVCQKIKVYTVYVNVEDLYQSAQCYQDHFIRSMRRVVWALLVYPCRVTKLFCL